MALVFQPVAGAYAGTLNALALGICRNGYTLGFQPKYELLNESDLHGETLLDGIFRGMDVTIDFVCRSAVAAGALQSVWPWGATRSGSANAGGAVGAGDFGTTFTPTLPAGSLMTDVAKSLVLTAANNTPAAILGTATAKAGPLTLTAPLAVVPQGFDGRILFDSKLREIPARLQLLPTLSTAQSGEPASGSLYHFIRT
jgi:hypothetical protein